MGRDAARRPVVLRAGREYRVQLAATALLVGTGVVMVFNTSWFYASDRFGDPTLFTRKHAAALVAGIIALAAGWRLPLAVLRRGTYPLLLAALAALVLVLVPGIG